MNFGLSWQHWMSGSESVGENLPKKKLFVHRNKSTDTVTFGNITTNTYPAVTQTHKHGKHSKVNTRTNSQTRTKIKTKTKHTC